MSALAAEFPYKMLPDLILTTHLSANTVKFHLLSTIKLLDCVCVIHENVP